MTVDKEALFYLTHDEFIKYYDTGELFVHCFYNSHRLDGEYKQWLRSGKLQAHYLYQNGKIVNDYMYGNR